MRSASGESLRPAGRDMIRFSRFMLLTGLWAVGFAAEARDLVVVRGDAFMAALGGEMVVLRIVGA